MGRVAVLVTCLLALAPACGPSRGIEAEPIVLDTFVFDFAEAYCHRAYACCDATDVGTASPGVNEADCVTQMQGFARANATFLLSFDGIAFDDERAAHCLDVLRTGPCDSIFQHENGEILPCQDMFPGTFQAGHHCGGPEQCASRRCINGRCALTPEPTCQKDQFLDENANTCVACVGAGEACVSSRQCASDFGCVHGVCTMRGSDGLACDQPDACLGTCGTGVCRPGFCHGP